MSVTRTARVNYMVFTNACTFLEGTSAPFGEELVRSQPKTSIKQRPRAKHARAFEKSWLVTGVFLRKGKHRLRVEQGSSHTTRYLTANGRCTRTPPWLEH